MKLSLKLALAVALMVTLVLVLSEWVALEREAALIEADVARDTRLVAQTLAGLVAHAGIEDPDEALSALNGHMPELELDWVPREALPAAAQRPGPPGRVLFRDDQQRRTISVLVTVGTEDGVEGAVEVTGPFVRRDDFVARALTKDALVVLMVTLFSVGAGLAVGHRIVGARVERLVDKARRVGRGDYGGPLDLRGGDELSAMARELNEMTDQIAHARGEAEAASEARLQAEVQLRHADRLTTVGQLAAGIAHELGTPLNVIAGRAALLERRLPKEDDARDARTIRDQARRITEIVKRMLDFARQARPAKRSVELAPLVAESVALIEATARKSGVEVLLDLDESVKIDVDPGQIQQVLINLALNGIQAMSAGGRLRVRLARERCGEEEHVHVVVSDEGRGIPPENLPRIFDPFFTTKEPGEGTGLGLSIVHGIIAEHGGHITVASAVGEGATFTVHLPGGKV